MNSRIVLTARCLVVVIVVSLAGCAAEPEPIILETPIASATPYVTAGPTDLPAAPTRTAPARPTPTPSPVPAPTLPSVSAQSQISNPQSQSARVNINTAGETALAALPRIGPTTARRIIAYRQKNGPFKRSADINNVSGIGDATFNAIKDLITVDD